MGSLWVTGDAWIVIAPTSPGPRPYGGGGEMCLWASTDQGKTWALKTQVTRPSPLNHNYARRPLNARDPFFAFWADGDPAQFSELRLYFCDSSGEHVRQLPYDMEGEFAEPVEIVGEREPLSPAAARHDVAPYPARPAIRASAQPASSPERGARGASRSRRRLAVGAAVVGAVEDELEVERHLGLVLLQGDRDAGEPLAY